MNTYNADKMFLHVVYDCDNLIRQTIPLRIKKLRNRRMVTSEIYDFKMFCGGPFPRVV